MSEGNKAVVQRFYDEVVAEGKLDVIDELVDENAIEHEEFPGLSPGRAGVKEFFAMFREAFPDARFEVEDMLAEGDRVSARITIRGTQKGQFLDIPATGKSIAVQAVDMFRFDKGRMVEHWGVTDQLTMMQQLGAIPK